MFRLPSRVTQFALILSAAALAGCAVGIRDDRPPALSQTIEVPVSYQEAYRRADAYARKCHVSPNTFRASFAVDGDLYTDNQTGVIHVTAPGIGQDLQRFSIAAHGAGSTISIAQWGVGIWGEGELRAAVESLQSGVLVCRRDR